MVSSRATTVLLAATTAAASCAPEEEQLPSALGPLPAMLTTPRASACAATRDPWGQAHARPGRVRATTSKAEPRRPQDWILKCVRGGRAHPLAACGAGVPSRSIQRSKSCES
jgi:hypothetical protein